jgi:eukaryotic-like serine/threonine-protein kinase
MSEPPLPPGFARRLEQLCTAFEEAWKGGQRPRIEDCLRQEEDRQVTLLRELLGLELDYRRVHGEQPRAEEYRRRFPTFAEAIDALFSEGTPEARGKDAGDLALTSALTSPTPQSPTQQDQPVDEWPAAPGYRIEGVLGRGGMGVVYRATQLGLNRAVALKMIHTGAAADPQRRERFRREAEAIARLWHPNIVQIYEVGEHDGRLFLPTAFTASPSARMGPASPPPHGTAPFACGRPPQGRNSSAWTATRTGSGVSPLARTASGSLRRARTARCASGTSGQGRNC